MVRIVIVGAGFVGLPTARSLAKTLGHQADITLIDHRSHFTFLPWLIDQISGDKTAAQLQANLSEVARRDRFRFMLGEVNSIDREQKRVFVVEPEHGALVPIEYDLLVTAPGSSVNYYGIAGAEEYCYPLKSTDDVEAIHQRVQSTIKKAMTSESEEEIRQLLSFVGVGAGASGIEALAGLKHYVTRLLNESAPELFPFASYTLIQGGPQILPGFRPKTVQDGTDSLASQGIRLLLSSPVTKVGQNFVLTGNGERVDCGLILWCGGIKPVEIPFTPDVFKEPNGTLVTDEFLRMHDGIYVAGDCITFRQQNVVIPKNAQTSLRMAYTISRNIIRGLNSLPPLRFSYRSLGSLVTVGVDGFLELPFITIKSRFIKRLRESLYQMRFKEITGGSPDA